MGALGVFIKTFDANGDVQSDFTEYTQDVLLTGLGSISKSLDITEFDIGIFRSSNFNITFDNTSGRYNDAGDLNSIFPFRRSNSILRVTWRKSDQNATTSFSTAGSIINATMAPNVVLFEGLINDKNLKFDAKDQSLKFTVLGKENIFNEVDVDISEFENGDNLSDVLFTILNKPTITQLLTVNNGNIAPGVDVPLDDKTEFENQTVREVLDTILKLTNSTLRIQNDTIFISNRDPSITTQFQFFNQNSTLGLENIIDLTNISNGLRRTFNFFTYRDTSEVAQDTGSIARVGVQRREIGNQSVTQVSSITSILQSFLTEFSQPRQELDITTELNYDTLDLELLDRVTIDYPSAYVEPAPQSVLPIVGEAVLGDAVLPSGTFNFVTSPANPYKIISQRINLRKNEVTFGLRRI